MQAITNLNFNGNAEEAFTFYAAALQGQIDGLNRYKEMPADPTMPLPAEYAEWIMHTSLSKNGKTIVMGADLLPMMSPEFIVGNNVEVCLMPESKEESDRIFAALSAGGKISMPMADQFRGDYFGSCTDKYGIGRMINCPGTNA